MKATLYIAILAATVSFKLWGCPQPHAATQQLAVAGYTDVQLEAWRGYRCLDYLHATGFKAKAPTGQEVSGAVCCGVLKACTTNISSVRP